MVLQQIFCSLPMFLGKQDMSQIPCLTQVCACVATGWKYNMLASSRQHVMSLALWQLAKEWPVSELKWLQIVENSDAVLPWVASLDDTACSYYDSTNVNSKFTGASWSCLVHEKVVRPKPNLPDCLLQPCNVITEGFCHKGRLSRCGNHIFFYFIVSTRVHWATKDAERTCNVHRRQTPWWFISSWFLVCALCNSCATYFARMTTGIPSAALVFGENLGCELEIKDFLVTKGATVWHTLNCCWEWWIF